ncbi:MAG TPA: PQQ-binding-like beta-propeller repeat protein [Sedimentisphaerales bacterium]|nr:PQQ-binding-like beta-propeller repeat protein [Sedimentisphaerales bacterium]
MNTHKIIQLLFIALAPAAVTAAIPDSERQSASQILAATGIKGGLVVHLGCGDGKLTAALLAGDNYTVQGLDPDVKNVETARKHIQSLGLYGSVSVSRSTSNHLPYVDNLVTLLVSESPGEIPMDEIMRVLAPLGVAYVKQDGQWAKTVKPWPKEIDEWQQHFHDADNNAVAHDRLVGPPRRYQWIAEPQWMRSHMSMPSISSLVSSKGRLFTVEDQASSEHPALPGRFALVARDAFNGIVLWQRPFPDWHPVNIRTKLTPVQLQRRLAAIGDTIYCTPGFYAPVTALEAATGKVIKTYDGTERTTEFLYDRGVLYAVIGDPTDTIGLAGGSSLSTSQFPIEAYGPRIPVLDDPKSTIAAIEAESGRTLWRKSGGDTAGYHGATLAVRGQHVVYATAKELVCLDRASGRQVWRVPAPIVLKDPIGLGGVTASLVLSEDAAYMADSESIRAFALKDGAAMWKDKAALNHHKPPDVFVAAGLVWSDYFNGHDPHTGKIVKKLSQKMLGPMGHDRCYRNRITERYYINTKTGGSDFLGLETPGEFPNPWGRSTCGIGYLPCNGLLYLGPPACSCCNWVMLNAMNALSPEPGLESSGQVPDVHEAPCLEKGPAFDQIRNQKTEIRNDADWPTYRHNAGRSGVTKSPVPADLKPCWEAKVTTRASAPIIAAGKVFVADVDAHAVCALDAANGRFLWRFTTGARVDSPPTWHEGLLLFGSRDGWVYALRASDGVLAWRFRGLPDRAICAYEQVESAWPVCGSILVKDDVAYFAAGRNSFLDGGIFLYGLDPQTGRIVHQRRMYGPYDADGYPIITSQFSSGTGIDGFKGDIFLTDGELLYLRQQAFKTDLTPLAPEDPRPPHLIPSPGFLETIPHHRTFWTIDTTIRYDIPAGKQAVYGDILVMDGKQFYEVRGYTPGRINPFDPRTNGYTLFAGVYSQANETVTQKRVGKRTLAKLAVRSVAEQRWASPIPLAGKALVMAGDTVFVAGTPVAFPADDLAKAYEGRMGGILWVASASTGEKVAECKLDAPPVWDGMAVANGQLFISLQEGRVMCMGGK